MAKRSKMRHPLTQAERRKFVSNVARLKALGLTSDRVDPRKQEPTRHMLDKIKRNSDVLSGKVQALKIKARKGQTPAEALAEAKASYPQFRVEGGRIMVPVRKGERVTFSTKTGIGSTRRQFGRIYRVRFVAGLSSMTQAQLQELRGPQTAFSIGFANWTNGITYRYWSDPAEMERDMAGYTNYRDWQNFLQVVTVIGTYDDDADEGDGGNGLNF